MSKTIKVKAKSGAKVKKKPVKAQPKSNNDGGIMTAKVVAIVNKNK